MGAHRTAVSGILSQNRLLLTAAGGQTGQIANRAGQLTCERDNPESPYRRPVRVRFRRAAKPALGLAAFRLVHGDRVCLQDFADHRVVSGRFEVLPPEHRAIAAAEPGRELFASAAAGRAVLRPEERLIRAGARRSLGGDWGQRGRQAARHECRDRQRRHWIWDRDSIRT